MSSPAASGAGSPVPPREDDPATSPPIPVPYNTFLAQLNQLDPALALRLKDAAQGVVWAATDTAERRPQELYLMAQTACLHGKLDAFRAMVNVPPSQGGVTDVNAWTAALFYPGRDAIDAVLRARTLPPFREFWKLMRSDGKTLNLQPWSVQLHPDIDAAVDDAVYQWSACVSLDDEDVEAFFDAAYCIGLPLCMIRAVQSVPELAQRAFEEPCAPHWILNHVIQRAIEGLLRCSIAANSATRDLLSALLQHEPTGVGHKDRMHRMHHLRTLAKDNIREGRLAKHRNENAPVNVRDAAALAAPASAWLWLHRVRTHPNATQRVRDALTAIEDAALGDEVRVHTTMTIVATAACDELVERTFHKVPPNAVLVQALMHAMCVMQSGYSLRMLRVLSGAVHSCPKVHDVVTRGLYVGTERHLQLSVDARHAVLHTQLHTDAWDLELWRYTSNAVSLYVCGRDAWPMWLDQDDIDADWVESAQRCDTLERVAACWWYQCSTEYNTAEREFPVQEKLALLQGKSNAVPQSSTWGGLTILTRLRVD